MKRAFTLVETLFYTAGLLVLIATMAGVMYYMYDWYERATIAPRIDRIGVGMVEKIIKDLRSGTSLNIPESNLNSQDGYISFNTYADPNSIIKYYGLIGNRLVYKENNGAETPFSPAGIYISKFFILATSTPVSKGVKFDIDITYTTRSQGSTTQTYSGFAILRQSYE